MRSARILRSSALAGLVVASSLGCPGDEPLPVDVVARVGTEAVETEEFDAYLRRHVGRDAAGLDSVVLSRLLDRMIEEELIRLLATDRGWIEPDAGRDAALAVLAERLASLEITDQEVARYSVTHESMSERPAGVRLRHLVTRDRQGAEEARERILSGASFQEVAREVSEAPARAPQELAIEDLSEPFQAAVRELSPGGLSRVVPA
ncbi:MAG: hypothetical protein R3234_12595, partial [Thermoanaerobaculia bacterium]|nr:hypothetical protein [Thermoanaerobaculia bacterium]